MMMEQQQGSIWIGNDELPRHERLVGRRSWCPSSTKLTALYLNELQRFYQRGLSVGIRRMVFTVGASLQKKMMFSVLFISVYSHETYVVANNSNSADTQPNKTNTGVII